MVDSGSTWWQPAPPYLVVALGVFLALLVVLVVAVVIVVRVILTAPRTAPQVETCKHYAATSRETGTLPQWIWRHHTFALPPMRETLTRV